MHADAKPDLDALDRRLLNSFQRDFPLNTRPFAVVAEAVGVDEETVVERYRDLQASGALSRIGVALQPHRAGWSTLAAMAVPPARLDEVAALVSGYDAVNHNYEREHTVNLWFVVAGQDRAAVRQVLADIESRTGIEVFDLTMRESFKLDLGFDLDRGGGNAEL